MSGSQATQTSHSDPPPCRYPQSYRVAGDIRTVLEAVAANKSKCTSFYLDTVEGMSNDFPYTEGEDHHQGLAEDAQALRRIGLLLLIALRNRHR